MRREPSLTFQGALAILGRREHRVIDGLDKLLGGVALGVAGPAALAPVGLLGAVWAWLGQRDEVLGLLREAIDSVSNKLAGTDACERQQLIAAAHTAIVVAAYFEALEGACEGSRLSRRRITEADREQAGIGRTRRQEESLYESLYSSEVPAPSAACGFEENCERVRRYMGRISRNLREMLGAVPAVGPADDPLAADQVDQQWVDPARWSDPRWSLVEKRAVDRYRSRYLELAAAVPEFAVWAMLGEHAATRSSVAGLGRELTKALNGTGEALSRLEAVLALAGATPAAGGPAELPSGSRLVLARANGGALGERILPEDASFYGPDITFPTIREIYVDHRYRLARCGDDRFRDMRLSDEKWWLSQPSHGDFDLMLAGHVTSSDATRVPMMLLGHPGAGKSMLMKVLAARLPPSRYTVVRVPLRRVDSDAPLIAQVQEALDLATNRRIEWYKLADQSRSTVRVVLLDGLDEMLQASQHDRGGYLQEIEEFQRREAEQERPTVVIVTSRTVVADRVNIPTGVIIVKLDSFVEADIASWLERWHRVNATAIAAGRVRELTSAAVDRQADLAAQPLLLLMLAIYAADPGLPALDGDLSTTELYQRILEEFTRREAAKDRPGGSAGPRPDRRAKDHIERLAVAALAMFNRGRQDIDEETLGRDLAALDPALMTRTRPAEDGQRIIGEFFFVHAPEARTLTGAPHDEGWAVIGGRGNLRRAYEFLHATFGEYLVARRVADELIDVADRAFAGRRGLGTPDDELLFALLSHQPLAARHTTLAFAAEILGGLADAERSRVRELLVLLLGGYRRRHGVRRHTAYQPVPPDQVRQLACYSANLVAMRTILEPPTAAISLPGLFGVPARDALACWQSTVRLWQAGLDPEGFQAMAGMLRLASKPDSVTRAVVAAGSGQREPAEIALSRLVSDTGAERLLAYGATVTQASAYGYRGDSWHDRMAISLVPLIVGEDPLPFTAEAPPAGTPAEEINWVGRLARCCLESRLVSRQFDGELVRLLLSLPEAARDDSVALTGAVLRNPELPAKFPELRKLQKFGDYAGIVDKVRATILPEWVDLGNPGKETAVAVRNLLGKSR
jgi:hypothetical protein